MKKLSTMETCFYGMKEFFDNNPTENFFHKDVLKDVESKNFKMEGITLVKVVNSHTCDVIAKDSKGHRSYRVGLEKNPNFRHYYKIFDVKGQQIVSTYQWRENL